MWARVFTGLSAVLLIAAATAADAQPVVTSPSSGTVFRAGSDYSSDVLQDPWDFSNYEDLSPNPDEFGGWATTPPAAWNAYGPGPTFINPAAGRFVGQAAGDDQLMLLHRGDAIGLNPGRTGITHPIDTSRYRKLAVKMRVIGAPANQQLVAYWYHDSYAASNYLNRAGGIVLPTVIPAGTSEQLYVFDLSQAGAAGSQLVPACGGGGACSGVPAPWTNEQLVRGLRLDPVSSFAEQGVQIDWVRLTAGDNQASAVSMPVNLSSCSSFSHFNVTDDEGGSYDVTDSTGNDTQRTFHYGILPPGSYTLRAVCANGTSAGTTFRINSPPMVTVIDPDAMGAESTDYAATHRGGDRWDFEQPTDLAFSENVSATAGACANGGCGLVPSDRPGAAPGSLMLRASSIGTNPSQLGDPALEFLQGALPPLSGRRHEYLTFSLRLHRPYNVGLGSVARILWGSQSYADASVVTQTQDLRVWPGFNTYTVDLAALTAQNGGIETECAPGCPTTPWPDRSIRFFRIDPHEFGDVPTAFDIDDVSLNAPDAVAVGQQFAVRYRFTDDDTAGSSYTARVYIETWPQRMSRALLHTAANVPPNTDLVYQFNPQASLVPPGRYAIFVEVTESHGGVQQVNGAYGTGPIVVYSQTATSPQLSVASPAPGQMVPFPFTIKGCAFDQGVDTGGINVDDVAAYAVAGPGVAGVAPGTTLALGFGNGGGTLQFGPLTGSPLTCGSMPEGSPYRSSGFRITDVGLQQGPWTLKLFARSTLSGELTPLGDLPVQVTQLTLAPENFQVTASGNTVTVSFQAPPGGPAVGGYAIDGSYNPDFDPAAFTVVVGAPGTYSGALGNGRYYLRVRSLALSGAPGMASETREVTLGPTPPAPPGTPELSLTQVSANPVTLSWTPGSGGTPTNYTIYAGTSPGASNLAVSGMGLATSVTATAPVNMPIYVRVVASNAAGSATSNEVVFTVGTAAPPGPPTLSPPHVQGSSVTLSWAPPADGAPSAAPTGYTIYARMPGSPAVVASLPVGGTSITVPASPGTYVVSVVAHTAGGTSPESNQVTVVVP